MISALSYVDRRIKVLNQSRLPNEVEYEYYDSAEEVAEAIRTLKVRGAPLIGIAAAFGLALATLNYSGDMAELPEFFSQKKQQLASTRPTAVNLFWALSRMETVFIDSMPRPAAEIGDLLIQEALMILNEDINTNRTIGQYGAELLANASQILTICNAGALATGGYGTALGVVRSAFSQGKIKMVWACETRPVLQGARLTVWELIRDSIPVTLITDSMAGYIMAQKKVDAVIVGADRIAANGDTANKIGTYTLAVLASYHQIPFYIAAPTSTLDRSIDNGDKIPIEERNADEIKYLSDKCISIPEVKVFNPAFDITPSNLIAGIITEIGVFGPPFDFFAK